MALCGPVVERFANRPMRAGTIMAPAPISATIIEIDDLSLVSSGSSSIDI
jgi:hypothetical protein